MKNKRKQPETKQQPSRARLVGRFLRGSKRYFVLAAVFTSLVSLFDLLNPQIIRFTVDSVLGGLEPEPGTLTALLPKLMGGAEFIRDHLWISAAAVLAVSAASMVCRYLFQLANAAGALSANARACPGENAEKAVRTLETARFVRYIIA